MGFKVIIAGGGPVGLTAALALSAAKIDFVVLEKHRQVVSKAGSDLVLSPVGLRALSQLGLYDEIGDISTPLDIVSRVDHAGHHIGEFKLFLHMKKFFGKSPRVLPRYELSRVLFNGLPEATRENVLCNKAISSVATTETGVTVDCADGTTYTGDMIIGTDGVHSTVRAQMNKLAREELGESINSDTLFPTTYRCVWMRFPVDGLAVAPGGDMAPGATCESHGYDAATQMFAADDHAAAGIYQKLEKPTTERLRFTKEDEEAVVAELGHLPLSRDGTVTVSSAYAMSTGSGIVALEEGVLDCWNWGGRIVLAGDSAHKFSPITGAGCNNGIIDVVVLVNELRALMQNDEKGSAPTAKDLRKVFESYEESRKPAVQEQCMRASQVTATATWATLVGRVMDLYVLPWAFVQKLFISLVASKVAETPCFDFLPADKHIVGTVAWKTPARVVV